MCTVLFGAAACEQLMPYSAELAPSRDVAAIGDSGGDAGGPGPDGRADLADARSDQDAGDAAVDGPVSPDLATVDAAADLAPPVAWAWPTGAPSTPITDVVAHADGSVTLVGWSSVPSATTICGVALPAATPTAFVLQLGAFGQCLMLKLLPATSKSSAHAVAVHAGVTYVTGSFTGTMTLEDTSGASVSITTSAADAGDIFVVALDSSGRALWLKKRGASYNVGPPDTGQALVATDGALYLAGVTNRASISSVCNVSECMHQIHVAQLDKATGTATWARSYGAGGLYGGKAPGLAVNASGEVYLGGTFQFALSIGSFSLGTNPKTQRAGFLAKLDDKGKPLWAQQYGEGPSSYASVEVDDLALAPGGGIFAVGYFGATITFPKGGSVALTAQAASGKFDGFLLRVSAAGVTQTVTPLGAPLGDHRLTAVVASSDVVWAAGQVDGVFGLGAPSAGWRAFVVRQDIPSGKLQQVALFDASPSWSTDLELAGSAVVLGGSASGQNTAPALSGGPSNAGFVAVIPSP